MSPTFGSRFWNRRQEAPASRRRRVRPGLEALEGRLVMAGLLITSLTDLPNPDAGNAVAIEHIKIVNEGWESDTSSTEPTET
jgi:hypothetical protein